MPAARLAPGCEQQQLKWRAPIAGRIEAHAKRVKGRGEGSALLARRQLIEANLAAARHGQTLIVWLEVNTIISRGDRNGENDLAAFQVPNAQQTVAIPHRE